MDKSFKKECINRFGQKGVNLFRAMEEIHHKDFYVEPGAHSHEIRIAPSTGSRTIIFEFNENYSQLIFPDGTKKEVEKIRYKDIRKYLPSLRM
ncbi:MAG: hypothetical protein WC584_03830 [Candidatus Pacearchaeota archaeon]